MQNGIISLKTVYRLSNLASCWSLYHYAQQPLVSPYEVIPLIAIQGFEALFPDKLPYISLLGNFYGLELTSINTFRGITGLSFDIPSSSLPAMANAYQCIQFCVNYMVREKQAFDSPQSAADLTSPSNSYTPLRDLDASRSQDKPKASSELTDKTKPKMT